jgi:hypothetical protein
MASNVLLGFDQYEDDKVQQKGGLYHFTPKNQYSVKNNPLCGICFPQWLAILRKRYRQIEWIKYWPRLLFITFMSILHSLLAFPEWLLYGRQVDTTDLHPTPVFILGHPRTGTTLLHSLLGLDDDQFALCTTFCAGFPSCFLWFEWIGKRIFGGIMDEHRPMDKVKLDFDLPQEDEIATNVLSAGVSPYMPLFFMSYETDFRPYYAFDQAATPELAAARKQWITSFLHLCHKLTLRSKLRHKGTRLLLKSPVHTARIPLLLSLFPEAQFIYLHRHPVDVFQSAAHMADTTYWFTYLQSPTDAEIQEFILYQYELLWEKYEAGRELLTAKQYVEVAYDELLNHPVEAVGRIYQHFGWCMSDDMQRKLRSEAQVSFPCNRHCALPKALQQVVEERWRPSLERLGYSKRK